MRRFPFIFRISFPTVCMHANYHMRPIFSLSPIPQQILESFSFLTIVNNAANIGVHIPLGHILFTYSGYIISSGLLCYRLVLGRI